MGGLHHGNFQHPPRPVQPNVLIVDQREHDSAASRRPRVKQAMAVSLALLAAARSWAKLAAEVSHAVGKQLLPCHA